MKDIKISIETEELPEDYPGIVPILMDLEENELVFEVYEGLEKSISFFVKEFEGKYFSKEAFLYLCCCVDEYLEDKPYLRDTYGRTRFYRKFYINEAAQVNDTVIKPSTVMMTRELWDIPNLTVLFAEDTGRIPPLSFVSIEDGKIVSVATVNDTESDKVREITVNTAAKYRGRGYGASNTAALARYLVNMGYEVAYCVSDYNKASIKIAKKCGFNEIGRFYAVTAYKTNNMEEG
ncbi:MAG: GNAT family N-acetyltransferase [Ruminococcaceae bacterium]|nr:GNAT family N-acetyltransferase [Oscillospiraceae bacterium]